MCIRCSPLQLSDPNGLVVLDDDPNAINCSICVEEINELAKYPETPQIIQYVI